MELTTGLYPLQPPPRCPLAPINGRGPPLSLELSHALLCPHAELEPPPLFASIAPPLRHRSCSGERPYGFTSLPSSSPASAGEPEAPQCLVCLEPLKHRHACYPLRPRTPWTRARRLVYASWTWSMEFPVGK
jgi:hypothetical protein